MQVSRIKIMNFMGIESLEFKAGQFVAFTGRNGSGKTSGLEAIKTAIGSGHDASVVRNGKEEAVVELGIDDGSMIRARVTESGTTREIRDQSGKKVSAPASVLKTLVDSLSVNPIEFLFAKPERRAQIILEAMPLQVDLDRMEAITGTIPKATGHALDVIRAERKRIYDERTETNGAAKGKRSTIVQLQAAISSEHEGVSQQSEEELRAQLEAVQEAKFAEIQRINSKLAQISEVIIGEIAALEAQIAEKKAKLSEQSAKANGAREMAEAKAQADSAEIRAELKVIESSREAAIRERQTRETIKAMDLEASRLESISVTQTLILGQLDEYISELTSSLPIHGVEIIEGVVKVDGVPFDRVNTARKIEIAVEIAKLRPGKLGLICVDGIEALDEDAFEQFKERAISSGIQMVVTRVSSNGFQAECE